MAVRHGRGALRWAGGIDAGSGFPAALHGYGTDCVWALPLL